LLVRLLAQSHTLVLSNEIIVEVIKVLRYPKFQSLYGLKESDLLEYSQFLQSVGYCNSGLAIFGAAARCERLGGAADGRSRVGGCFMH
jgi:hypothetical protein